MEVRDDVGARGAVCDRVNDEDVSDLRLDGVSQRIPPSGWDERVLRTEDDCELRVELTGEVCDDVHD